MASPSLIAKYVKTSLLASAGVALSLPVATHAIAEEESAAVERIEVTGSRIQRADMETSSPITVIDRATIDASGMPTISDFVRNLAQNSFGSFRDASGFGSGQSSQSTVDLRGLGPQRTLILIDGRRTGYSVAFGGATQNLNTIPMAAVKRVEILRDGASAVYGSDAIAGVINVITNKEYEGGNLEVEFGRPQQEGADESSARFTVGSNSDKTNIVASVEFYKREALYDRQREYSNIATGTSFGWPGGGIPSHSDEFIDERCPENLGDSADFPNSYIGANGRCNYDFTADSATMAAQQRFSTFVNINHQLTDDVELFSRALVSRIWTEGRYAAAPVTAPYPLWTRTEENKYLFDAAAEKYGFESFIDEETGELVHQDVLLLMRTVPNGNRDTEVEDTEVNLLGGLRGDLDLFGGANWEIGTQFIRSEVSSISKNLANKVAIQNALDSGDLNFFGLDYVDGDGNMVTYTPGEAEAVMAGFNSWGIFRGRTQTVAADANLSFDMFDLPAGSVPLALGLEWNTTSFMQENDPASNRLELAGTSGGDNIYGKKRDIFSASAETIIPVIEGLDVNLSARYDNYSDFGSTTNPKVGITYRPFDMWLLRGSWGKGFRAPGFDDLYGNASESFPTAIDTTACELSGDKDSPACAAQQYRSFYGGNEQLDAEKSESLTFGTVVNLTDNWDVELGYYAIEIKDTIGTISAQKAFDLEATGIDGIVFRNDDGSVDFLKLTTQNLGVLNTSGIDFNTNLLVETGFGDINFKVDWNYIIEWNEQPDPTEDKIEYIGEMGSPQMRGNVGITWMKDDISASWNSYYIDKQSSVIADETYSVGNHITHDLQFGYNAPWNGKVSVGVRNLTNKDPELNHDYYGHPGYDLYLYSPIGRTYYLRYSQQF
ncbi:TonB-dependent receptor plug domain-containing protein [Paraferrimonas sedimenticola]|uniref:TonB-dependent receptor n=1 Tax=Paraferrimonas sedimenticola TaxID=375674 RepID=A0AA37RWE1_9GAMM|nr:TonB-dependent receptor [Paraferrimonas sedimenticola]GLP96920.1 TonB-dependent receptor [Paraferrimonas sedimenticola]